MIPKIFHQVWLGSNPLPEEHVRYRETWAQHHPGWEFRLWTEDNLPDNLVHAEVRNRLRVPAERADILRLEVLYQQGGVYLDTDMECLRPIDELIADVDVFAADSKPGTANNAVLGAVAGHPFIAHALSECRPREFSGYDKAAAGPWLIDRLVREDPTVRVFEPWIFYPSTPEERARGYAIHHAERSWKDAEGFRTAALIAEKRLQEVQDDLWRATQAVEDAVQLNDAEQLRTRMAQIAEDYRPKVNPSPANSKPIEGLDTEDADNSRDLIRAIEKRVALRMRRQLKRVEHRLARLDQRVTHLEKRKRDAAASVPPVERPLPAPMPATTQEPQANAAAVQTAVSTTKPKGNKGKGEAKAKPRGSTWSRIARNFRWS